MIYWKCPQCIFEITDTAYKAARYDYKCPHCKRRRLSQFNRIEKLPMNPWEK